MTRTARHQLPWFDVSTPDPEQAKRFYSALFEWQTTNLDDTYTLVSDAQGQQIGGIGKAGSESPYLGALTSLSRTSQQPWNRFARSAA